MKDVKVRDRIKVTTDMPDGQPIRLGDELTVKFVNDDGKFCAALAHDESNVLFFLIEAWFDVVCRADEQASPRLKKFGLVLSGEKGWSYGQVFSATESDAVEAGLRAGFPVWRAFDLEKQSDEWDLVREVIYEISDAQEIDPKNPIRLGVIKEETK